MEEKAEATRLSELDLAILHHLSDKRSLQEISEVTKVEPAVVGKEVARLQIDGYVSAEGSLTEKGLEAMRK